MEKWCEQIYQCKYLPELDLKNLCELVKDLLLEESNIHPISSPVSVVGDIHGQFYDLLKLFKVSGEPKDTNYIFMGDFVDRGYYSLETFTLLMIIKVMYPDKITLLRGNHESRQITQVYGFYDECQQKYGNPNAWKYCAQVFDLITIAALVDGNFLCVHGGLSPDIRTLDQIRTITRNQEIPHDGPFCDLLWSDPEDGLDTWEISPRGAGWLFGCKVTQEFENVNGLTLIARSHQLVQEGYKYHFNEKVITVWSAPNYCYRCGNVAAVLKIGSDASKSLLCFEAESEENRKKPSKIPLPYFL